MKAPKARDYPCTPERCPHARLGSRRDVMDR
jgi:hypothetical protein